MLVRVLPCVSLFFAGSLALSAQSAIPTAPLALSVGHPIVLTAGDGTISFTLTNSTDAAIPLTLVNGPVTDLVSGAVLPKASIKLAPLGSPITPATASSTTGAAAPKVVAPVLPESVAAHGMLVLQATAVGIAASSAAFDLYNGATKLGQFTLAATDAPFNISLDGENTASKPLDYSYGKPVMITLKNSDPEPYHLHWEFRIDGNTQGQDDLNIPAQGNTQIRLTPGDSQVFSLFDYIHPEAKQGTLILSVVGPDVAAGLLPTRALPVNLLMRSTDPVYSNLLSYAYAAVLLGLGGFLSFVASSMLPAMQKKANMRSQLQGLRSRTTSVSTRIDSYLRVLLRLERSRIADAIDNASPWVLASADQSAQSAAAIATLTKRLLAAERLDDLRRKHDMVCETTPPSITDGIDASLQAAADQLHSFALSDTDLAAAGALFAKAQTALDRLSDTDAMATLIAGNVASLKLRLARFPPNYYADVKAALPGVWFIVDPSRGFDVAKNVTRPMLFAIDHGAAAIQLALDYAMVRASIPGNFPPAELTPELSTDLPPSTASNDSGAAGVKDATAQPLVNQAPLPDATILAPPADAPPLVPLFVAQGCAALGQDQTTRLLAHQRKLIELLGTLSWRALREASQLVQEMREDVYEEDILAEIKKPCQAEITIDTQKTRPFSPVFFNITFRNAKFNDAAAIQRLLCHWSFPDQLEEHSWKVCHYFTSKEKTDGSPPIPCPAPEPSAAAQSSSAPEATTNFWHRHWPLKRKAEKPEQRDFTVYATIRGQLANEAQELPLPPMTRVIHLEPAVEENGDRNRAEQLRFAIAFIVALAGLLSGALDNLDKLSFVSATTAILALGFTANSVKNLLTQSAEPTQVQPRG